MYPQAVRDVIWKIHRDLQLTTQEIFRIVCFMSEKVKRKRPVRVILFGTWAEENLGDDLMLRVMIDRIRERYPEAELIVPTGNCAITEALLRKEGVSLKNINLLYTGRWGLREPGKPFFRSFAWIFSELRELFRADLLLIGPGNQIQDVTRRYRVLFFIARAIGAWVFRTPFAYVGIGYYSLSSRFCKRLLRFTAKRAAFVSTRDSGGAADFESLGVPDRKVHGLTDVSFTHPWPEVRGGEPGAGTIPPVIGLTSRVFLKEVFPEDVSSNFERCYAALIHRIHEETGAVFRFFPFYRGSRYHDGVALERLLGHLGQENVPIELVPFEDIGTTQTEMVKCDAFIGTRYHSVLISIQSGLPVLAFGYGKKTVRFMTEQGLSDYCIPVEDVTLERLTAGWEHLWSDRDGFRERARRVREQAGQTAAIHFDLIERTLEANK